MKKDKKNGKKRIILFSNIYLFYVESNVDVYQDFTITIKLCIEIY